MLHHDEIKPATTPAATRRGAILMPDLLEVHSRFLCRKTYTSVLGIQNMGHKSPTLSCSVGNGPPPTRVVYALITPITFPMRRGGIPRPVHIPPTVVELL